MTREEAIAEWEALAVEGCNAFPDVIADVPQQYFDRLGAWREAGVVIGPWHDTVQVILGLTARARASE